MRFAMYDTSLESRLGEHKIIKRFLWLPSRIHGVMKWFQTVYVKQEIKQVQTIVFAVYNRNPDWVDIEYVKEKDYVDFQRNQIEKSSVGN